MIIPHNIQIFKKIKTSEYKWISKGNSRKTQVSTGNEANDWGANAADESWSGNTNTLIKSYVSDLPHDL